MVVDQKATSASWGHGPLAPPLWIRPWMDTITLPSVAVRTATQGNILCDMLRPSPRRMWTYGDVHCLTSMYVRWRTAPYAVWTRLYKTYAMQETQGSKHVSQACFGPCLRNACFSPSRNVT